jgi:hypothetical protein
VVQVTVFQRIAGLEQLLDIPSHGPRCNSKIPMVENDLKNPVEQ